MFRPLVKVMYYASVLACNIIMLFSIHRLPQTRETQYNRNRIIKRTDSLKCLNFIVDEYS